MGELYSLGFSVVSTIIGIAIMWGKVMEKINRLDKDMDSLKSSIWKKNGTSIYVTDKEHMRAYQSLKEDVKEMKEIMTTQLSQFREELERQAERNSEEFRKISNFMGRVEQFLLEHGKTSIRR